MNKQASVGDMATMAWRLDGTPLSPGEPPLVGVVMAVNATDDKVQVQWCTGDLEWHPMWEVDPDGFYNRMMRALLAEKKTEGG